MMRRRKVVLIADDEPHVVQLVRLILERTYTVVAAEDGAETVALLKRLRPDLIVLDIMMPEVNGYEICERLKQDPATKAIPVIMLSAKTQERDIIQGLRVGADEHIPKPFDPAEFERRIDAYLSP